MLFIVQNLDIHSKLFLQTPFRRVDRAVAHSLEPLLHACIRIENRNLRIKLRFRLPA